MQIDQALAGSTCTAESSTHPTLRLYTIVGPVLRRGLRDVMILGDMLAILVGRDLLKALGLDPLQMLPSKLSEGLIPPELDVSGIPSIFSESARKSMSFDQAQDHHTILTEVGYSHTLAQSSDHDRVIEVFDGMVCTSVLISIHDVFLFERLSKTIFKS